MRTWSLTKSNWDSNINSSQDVRNMHPCTLSLLKLLGAPGLTLEGCNAFRGVVAGGGEAGGGGATFLAASWFAMTARNLFRFSFIAQVASACSLSLFSICCNLSSSMAGESTTVDDHYGGEQGVVGSIQRSFALLCVRLFVLLSYTNQCP
jgi:hypothetical protein